MSSSNASADKTSSPDATGSAPEVHAFQAETRQVMRLMVHSLYSNKEIFLRELISNASDALDRLRFAGLQNPEWLQGDSDLRIEIEADTESGTLTVRDNGIGMTREEVLENIGTIAHSGTRRFLEQLEAGQKADRQQIGQFGVGFYSAFIVADSVTLLTRKAGTAPEQGVRWVSDGEGEFSIETADVPGRGTSVVLQLKEDEKEFLQHWNLKQLVQRYSDHVGFPIHLRRDPQPDGDKAGEDGEWEQVNTATALWALPRNELSDSDYQGFYKHLTHDVDDPLCWAHNTVEGAQSYTTLLYVPRKAPFDLALQRDERHGLRLYVNRVFIMDAAQHLLPHYLRFVRGVVDSQDLPLNVSRELLQENVLVDRIRAAVVRRSLDMIGKLNEAGGDEYAAFWKEFGTVLKEGVVEDPDNRERILPLLRFESTRDADPADMTDLPAYVERMTEGQDAIYFITAEHAQAAANSPHLEVFRKNGIEVLLMSDRVDEWMMSYLHEFDGKPFKSVAKGDIDLGKLSQSSPDADEGEPESGQLDEDLIQRIDACLGDRVSAVRASQRLTDSASCLVLGEGEMALHLQKMLQQAGQPVPGTEPILELNASHPLVERLAVESDEERFEMLSVLLYEQALLAEGGSLEDPAGFVRRMNRLMTVGPATD
ncbi:molecular chaperone HtpG [Elongatibacter sediminis]|uniref:Chaperone protein HtpG n=1 Tax=Elongatibacter sediminis TaxID=3119006 RepID=A0AAW9RIT7_9GAMM